MQRQDSGITTGSQIRLRYASLSVYVLNFFGAFFSFLFLALLARKLSVEDYAIWVMVFKYIGYVAIPSVIYTFWLQRNISRGQNSSRTGLYSSLLFSVVSLPFYLILIYVVSAGFDQPIVPLTLSTAILFFEYVNSSLSSVSSGYAPEINGYASIALKSGECSLATYSSASSILG